MSQEPKFSSEHQTHNEVCSSCGEVVVDHVYSVQRRRIRKVSDNTLLTQRDVVDPSHGGVILGPEFDLYCSTCYESLPTIQELIDVHKNILPQENINDLP